MSLSKIFLKAAFTVGAGLIGMAAAATDISPSIDSPQSEEQSVDTSSEVPTSVSKLSRGEEIAITHHLKGTLPVISEIIQFRQVKGLPSIEKAFNDLAVRKLAFVMSSNYAKRCGDPMKRKDICHVRNGESYFVLNYAWETEFLKPQLKKLAQKISRQYASQRFNFSYRVNCYSYAVGDYFLNEIGGAQPGEVKHAFNGIDKTAKTIFQGAIDDGLISAGNDPAKLIIPDGKRLVLLYVHEEKGQFQDYHWTRIDRWKDGSLVVSQKMGLMEYSHSYAIHNIYDEMRRNFADQGEGYKFKGFFYVPIEGLDVGVDAYARYHGIAPPLTRKLNVIPQQRELDVADFNTYKAYFSNEKSPQ